MKKKIIVIISLITLIMLIVGILFFSQNKKYRIVTEVDYDDQIKVKEYEIFLKDNIDLEIERITFNIKNVSIMSDNIEFKNGVDFILASNNTLYVIENDLGLPKEKIPGTNLFGYKTKVNNIVNIFYCSSVSTSNEHTLYGLDKDGNLYFISSSMNLNIKDLNPVKLKYKKVIDVYSKYICEDDECYSLNVAKDINEEEYIISNDYEYLYYGI